MNYSSQMAMITAHGTMSLVSLCAQIIHPPYVRVYSCRDSKGLLSHPIMAEDFHAFLLVSVVLLVCVVAQSVLE
jgi:hypothetical protein